MAAGRTYVVNATAALIASNLSFSCGHVSNGGNGSRTLLLTTDTSLNQSDPYCHITASNTVIWSAYIDTGYYFVPPYTESTNADYWTPLTVTVNGVQGRPITSFSGFESLSSLLYANSLQYMFTNYISLTPLPPGISINLRTGTISGTPTAPFDGPVQFAVENAVSKEQSAVIGTLVFHISAPPTSSSISIAAYAAPVGFFGLLLFLIPVVLFLRERRKNRLKPHNFEQMLAALQDIRSGGEKQTPREIQRSKLKLLTKLGEGFYGEVHKGLLGEIAGVPGYIVAVKSLKMSVDGAEAHRAPMLLEAALMAQFAHPRVISLIGVVTLGDPLLVVLEYCEYGALYKHLQTAQLDDEARLKLAIDCAEGMEYLASNNFVHRDLASRNVLLDSEHRCKIADFGMSREIVDDDEYYRSRGGQLPVRWTAPEALDERKFSEQSDVWSFGVLLWEIWSQANMPYKGMTNQKVWTNVMAGYRLPQPYGCPDAIYDLMSQCWFVCSHRPEFKVIARTLRRLSSNIIASVVKADARISLAPSEYVDFSRSGSKNSPVPAVNSASEIRYTPVTLPMICVVEHAATEDAASSHYEESIRTETTVPSSTITIDSTHRSSSNRGDMATIAEEDFDDKNRREYSTSMSWSTQRQSNEHGMVQAQMGDETDANMVGYEEIIKGSHQVILDYGTDV